MTAPPVEVPSQSLASACAEVIAQALSTKPLAAPASAESHERSFFSAIAHMDLPAAKHSWALLGDRGPAALAKNVDGKHGIFAAWSIAAKEAPDWGVPTSAIADMLLWLDDIGACLIGDPPLLSDTAERIAKLASGGADKLSVRLKCLAHWTFCCERLGEITPEISNALALAGARWISDPDESSRISPSACIEAAFYNSDKIRRPTAFLNLLADLWPSFGFDPRPEHWRMVADGWVLSESFFGFRSISAVSKLLSMGSDVIEPSIAGRLALMATRTGYVRVLEKIANRCPALPFRLVRAFGAQDDPEDSLKISHGPAPLILVAAMAPCLSKWQSITDTPPVFNNCFKALSLVPQAVEAALAQGPRPDLLAHADPRLLGELHRQFPAWFEPDASGRNVLHALAEASQFNNAHIRLVIQSCRGSDALLAMLGACDHGGSSPLSLFSSAPYARLDQPLRDELSALAEAYELLLASPLAQSSGHASRLPSPRL